METMVVPLVVVDGAVYRHDDSVVQLRTPSGAVRGMARAVSWPYCSYLLVLSFYGAYSVHKIKILVTVSLLTGGCLSDCRFE